jgi:TPR repeat protein
VNLVIKIFGRTIVALYCAFTLAGCETPSFAEGDKAFGNKNYSEALKIFRPLAEEGHAPSQLYLGIMHDAGLGVEIDKDQAEKWTRNAAQNGFNVAQFLLAQDLVDQKRHKEARVWLEKAAATDLARAQRLLAIMHQAGWGGPKDDAAAFLWFRRAADLGDPEAQAHLGLSYMSGKGVGRDQVAALKWFYISASFNNPLGIGGVDMVENSLSEAEILHAKSEARAWLERFIGRSK